MSGDEETPKKEKEIQCWICKRTRADVIRDYADFTGICEEAWIFTTFEIDKDPYPHLGPICVICMALIEGIAKSIVEGKKRKYKDIRNIQIPR